MAKAHCSKHKRYVHNCPGCQSEALRETVGFPKTDETPPADETASDVDETVEHVGESDADEGGDIAEWEPEVEEVPTSEPMPLPSYVPAGETEPPADLPEVRDIDETEEAMAAEGEFDPEPAVEIDGNGNVVPVTPGEGEPEPFDAAEALNQMAPIDVAMVMFPRRLIPEGATEVCDEERPDEPYMASYEELVRRALAGYLEMGLNPEDAVIVVGAEVIKAEQLGAGEATEALTEEELEAFDAGLEAAPELTGCIEDYNNGFNSGMAALLSILRGYYSGDEDAVAYAVMRWMESQAAGIKK